MTEVQAAIGLAQLDRFVTDQAQRRRIIQRYERTLSGERGFEFRAPREGVTRAYWLVCVLLPSTCDRDQVAEAMMKRGIETRPMFPVLPTMPAYEFYTAARFPVAEDIARRGLVLPTYPTMTDALVDSARVSWIEAFQKGSHKCAMGLRFKEIPRRTRTRS